MSANFFMMKTTLSLNCFIFNIWKCICDWIKSCMSLRESALKRNEHIKWSVSRQQLNSEDVIMFWNNCFKNYQLNFWKLHGWWNMIRNAHQIVSLEKCLKISNTELSFVQWSKITCDFHAKNRSEWKAWGAGKWRKKNKFSLEENQNKPHGNKTIESVVEILCDWS